MTTNPNRIGASGLILVFALFLPFKGDASAAQGVSQASEPKAPTKTRIEQAAFDTVSDSLQREIELEGELKDASRQLVALVSIPNADPHKSFKDSVPPAKVDELNLLNLKIRYLRFCIYGEVLKRREIRILLSLNDAAQKYDAAYSDVLSSGLMAHNASDANDQISKKMEEQGVSDWNAALTALQGLQDIKDARSISLEGLLERLIFSKAAGPSSLSDDLGFLNAGDLKNTAAYKVFVDRLQTEIASGNSNAANILNYLQSAPAQ